MELPPYGIEPKKVRSGSRFSGSLRLAPFGSPVVPEVKMTMPPGLAGFGWEADGRPSARPESVGRPWLSSSAHATTTWSRGISEVTSRNSWSTIANLASSRRVSSPSWDALAIVLSSRTFAPICMIETIETTIHRWLRPMSATASPTSTPRSLSAAVVRLISSLSSRQVISPASSTMAVWCG